MDVVAVFMLGIANFAMHRASVESGHPLLGAIRASSRLFAPQMTYGAEFILLVVALWLANGGAGEWVWIYGFYTGFNAASTWALLTGRL